LLEAFSSCSLTSPTCSCRCRSRRSDTVNTLTRYRTIKRAMLRCMPSLSLSTALAIVPALEAVSSSFPQVNTFPSSCLPPSHAEDHVAMARISLMQKATGLNQILAKNSIRGSSNETLRPLQSTWIAPSTKGELVLFLQARHAASTIAILVAVAVLVIAIGRMLVHAWSKPVLGAHERHEEKDSDSSIDGDDSESMIHASRSIGFNERDHYDSKHYNAWKLLFNVLGALIRFWGLLAIMEFALLQDTNALMDCDEPSIGAGVRHICKYTKACLHSYPVVCANMTLVLMVRVLVQMQLYYSLLKRRCVVDFVSVQILSTPWPWICAFSMLQGGSHFVLKTYIDLREVNLHFFRICAAAGYKFIIPGIMFLSFFPHYTEVENMLVPLNRIVEQDYTKHNRKCPWLSEIEVANERVLAKDVRDKDIFERSQRLTQKERLTIDDIVDNILLHYENLHAEWLANKHSGMESQRAKWVFKAMWPVAVLFHTRMDWQDAETRQWMYVLGIMLSGSLLASLLSLFMLISFCDPVASLVEASLWQSVLTGRWDVLRTDAILANVVLTSHGFLVLFFLYRTIWGMFYQRLRKSDTDKVAVGIIILVFFVFGFFAKLLYEFIEWFSR